jgi:hypothetical protein
MATLGVQINNAQILWNLAGGDNVQMGYRRVLKAKGLK